MFCKNCGHSLDEGASFCPSCGKATQEAPTPPPQSVYYGNPYDAARQSLAGGAQTWGIVSLVITLVCCPLLGFIFSFVALSKANRYKSTYGVLEGGAMTGYVLGWISLGLNLLWILGSVIGFAAYGAVLGEMLSW